MSLKSQDLSAEQPHASTLERRRQRLRLCSPLSVLADERLGVFHVKDARGMSLLQAFTVAVARRPADSKLRWQPLRMIAVERLAARFLLTARGDDPPLEARMRIDLGHDHTLIFGEMILTNRGSIPVSCAAVAPLFDETDPGRCWWPPRRSLVRALAIAADPTASSCLTLAGDASAEADVLLAVADGRDRSGVLLVLPESSPDRNRCASPAFVRVESSAGTEALKLRVVQDIAEVEIPPGDSFTLRLSFKLRFVEDMLQALDDLVEEIGRQRDPTSTLSRIVVRQGDLPDRSTLAMSLNFAALHLFGQGRLWQLDHGPVPVRPPLSLEEVRMFATFAAVCADEVRCLDPPDTLPPERAAVLRRCSFPAAGSMRAADLFRSDAPRVFVRRLFPGTDEPPQAASALVALFNPEDHPEPAEVCADECGLDPLAAHEVWDFWDERRVGTMRGRWSVPLSPAACRVVLIRPISKDSLLEWQKDTGSGIHSAPDAESSAPTLALEQLRPGLLVLRWRRSHCLSDDDQETLHKVRASLDSGSDLVLVGPDPDGFLPAPVPEEIQQLAGFRFGFSCADLRFCPPSAEEAFTELFPPDLECAGIVGQGPRNAALPVHALRQERMTLAPLFSSHGFPCESSEVIFRILVDGRERFTSPPLRTRSRPMPARAALPGACRLTLVAQEAAGATPPRSFAAFLNPRLIRGAESWSTV